MITISNLSKSYNNLNNPINALSNINLKVKPSEILGIFGKSGSGKSTFLRILNGLETPSSGDISIFGQSLTSLTKPELRNLRRQIGFVFQNYNLLYSLSVFKNIALPLETSKISKTEITNKINNLLQIVGLEDKKDAQPGVLSGGQRQRVAIARALATNPKILLCDEPTSALDSETGQSILLLLKSINQNFGTTIILISHDEDDVKEYCHRFVRFENGSIKEISHV